MYYPNDFKHLKPSNDWLNGNVNVKKSKLSTRVLTNVLKEFCEESSFHGLTYIQDPTLPFLHRGFWFVTFMICLAAAVMTIFSTYQNFYSDQVQMSMKRSSNPIKDIPFPAIMICSSYPVRKSYFDLDLLGGNTHFRHYSKIVCPSTGNLAKERHHSYLAHEFFNFLENASIPCNKFLMNCRWNNIEEDCCEIFKPFVSSLGKCYVFNSFPENQVYRNYTFPVGYGRPRDDGTQLWSLEMGYPDRSSGQKVYPRWSEIPGAFTGLTVTLLENRSEWQQDCNGMSSGSNLVLFPPLEQPEASKGVKLPLRLHTHVRLKPNFIYGVPDIKSIPVQERLCVFEGEVFLKYYNTYNQYNCLHECFVDKVLEKCGCIAFQYQGALEAWNKPFCGDSQQFCVFRVLSYIFGLPDGPKDTTKCICMPLCTSLNFDVTSSFERLEHSKQKQFGSTSFNYSHGTIVSQVSVYYTKDEFVPLLRWKEASFFNSLSNCGGLLGLLLGFSFMSAFEIFYFLLLRPLVKMIKKYSS